MNKQLPNLITIRITETDGTEGRVQVTQAQFAQAWWAAQRLAPKGSLVQALIAEIYI